ncbi:MAG: Nif3-like dinuclear metal center hexameric protein [Promethearchaeota archaeon]
MILSQIESVIEKNFPLEWTLQHYTPGFAFGRKKNQKIYSKIAVTTFATNKILLELKKKKIHLLLTYYPLFPPNMMRINDVYITQIQLLTLGDITLYTLGDILNFIEGGVGDVILRAANLNHLQNFSLNFNNQKIPVGRIGKPFYDEIQIEKLLQNLKRNLKPKFILFHGDPNSFAKKIVSIDPISLNKVDFNQIIMENIDTVITYDLSYEISLKIENLGVNLIILDSKVCLQASLEKFVKKMSILLPRMEIVYLASPQKRLLI